MTQLLAVSDWPPAERGAANRLERENRAARYNAKASG
jgi:hypothetical protein